MDHPSITHPLHNVALFARIASYTSSVEDLYSFALINWTTHEVVHSHLEMVWKRVITQSPRSVERSVRAGRYHLLSLSLRFSIPVNYKQVLMTAVAVKNDEAVNAIVSEYPLSVYVYEDVYRHCCIIGEIRYMTLFLDLGVDVNGPRNCDRVIDIVIAHGDIRILELLLSRGLKVVQHPTRRPCSLRKAIEKQRPDILNLLLYYDHETSPHTISSIMIELCDREDLEMLKIFVQHGFSLDHSTGHVSCISHAIGYCSIVFIRELIKLGANGSRPELLDEAMAKKRDDAIVVLLYAGADPLACKSDLLLYVCKSHKITLLRAMIDTDLSLRRKRPAFLIEFLNGYDAMTVQFSQIEDIVELLLKIDLDVDAELNGRTALERAIELNRKKLIRLLLHAGASIKRPIAQLVHDHLGLILPVNATTSTTMKALLSHCKTDL